MPDQMNIIGESAFARTAFTEIVLPSGLLYIDEACFMECNSLVLITIPENVTEIGRMAFLNCHSLQSVTKPIHSSNMSFGVSDDMLSTMSGSRIFHN